MIEALILGHLYTAPNLKASEKNGAQYAVAKLRAAIGDTSAYIECVAFDYLAREALMTLNAGDSVAIGGELKVGAWLDKAGTPRPNLTVFVSQAMTNCRFNKRRTAEGAAAEPGNAAQTPPGARPTNKPTSPPPWEVKAPPSDALTIAPPWDID